MLVRSHMRVRLVNAEARSYINHSPERFDLAQIWKAPRPIAWRSIRHWVLTVWVLLFLADATLTRLGVSLLPRRRVAG